MYVGKQTLVERLTRMSVALAAAVALFTFFDVQTSFASCGDYVTVGGVMVGGGAHADHGLPGDASHSVPACKGPNCQRSLPLPVGPTKGLPSRPHSDAACWASSHEPPFAARFGEISESSLLVAEGHSLPLLRPPCL